MKPNTSGVQPMADLWNGTVGENWVKAQQLLDDLFKPVEDILVDLTHRYGASNVLDVGCGTGATSFAIARAIGNGGRCTGIDISEPMVAAARAEALQKDQKPEFVCADAQSYPFLSDRFDLVVSRFGVMFFDDSDAAFQNLRRATQSMGRLHFFCWRSPEENPFMTQADRAAAPLMTRLPERKPDGPGQFAFADKGLIGDVLRESGWGNIEINPVDLEFSMPANDLEFYFTHLGVIGAHFQLEDKATQAKVIRTLHNAFERYIDGDDVRFQAALWHVAAQKKPS